MPKKELALVGGEDNVLDDVLDDGDAEASGSGYKPAVPRPYAQAAR